MDKNVNIQLSVQNWLALSQEVRAKLIELFNIRKTGIVTVEGGQVKCDGCTYEDLGKISVEKMQEVTGSKEKEFVKLFGLVLDRVHDILNPVAIDLGSIEVMPQDEVIEATVSPEIAIVEEKPKKTSKTTTKAKKIKKVK